MKTALLLSAFVIGGHMITHQSSFINVATPGVASKSVSYQTSTRKKSSLAPIAPVKIVVDKSNYELSVYDAQGWYATYPVVFGNPSLADKKMEGDRNTPEGTFRIVAKRVHNKWTRYMALDYPTSTDLQKFAERKRRGEIPPNAKPGGGIGIHGVFPHEDFSVDRYNNWTNGCISLKNGDVQELYNYIALGTPITIKK